MEQTTEVCPANPESDSPEEFWKMFAEVQPIPGHIFKLLLDAAKASPLTLRNTSGKL